MKKEQIVNSIIEYINQNLYDQITIDNLVKTFYYDRAYMSRLFKNVTGKSIVTYVNDLRIASACNQLKNTDDSILKVALDNGFNSLEYFSLLFSRINGVSPSEYRHQKRLRLVA